MSSNTNLGPTPVNQGYVQLIHIGETGGIDGTLRTIYDGDGTASDLQIASNAVKISTQLYIGSDTIQEYIQDVVGTMFTTGSYTNISTTYDDINGNIDLNATGAISSIIAGTGISVSGSGDITIAIDSTVVTLTGTQTLTNKTLTSPTINAPTINTSLTFDSVALTAIQTSAEAFADNNTSIMTSAAIDDRILSYGYSTTTGTVTSVSGGNGLTGTITSSGSLNVGAGTHITVNADDVAVNTTTLFASPAFTGTATGVNLTLSGDLTVNGTTTTLDTTNLLVEDNIIQLNTGKSGVANTNDAGIFVERGTTGNDAAIIWDESQDRWVLGTTTASADATGDITYTEGSVQATTFYGALSGNASTATKLGTARNIAGVAFDGSASIDIPIGNLSDVTITSPTNNQALIYNFGTGVWENGSAGLTYNGSTANGVLTYGSSTTIDVESNLTFDGSNLNLAGNLKLTTNATYLYSKDASGNSPRMFGMNSGNNTYIGPIDAYAGGSILYGASSNVADQIFYTSGSERLRIKATTGNVGIGTASPGALLDVGGRIKLTSSGVLQWGSSANYGNLTWDGDSAIVQGQSGRDLDLRSGSSRNILFKIGSSEKVRINSSGNVGIGTTSPNRLLHLQSTGDAIMQITSADGSGAYIDLGDVSDVDGGRIVYDSGSNLLFNTASTEKMRIDSSGRLLIGDTSVHYAGVDLQVGNTSDSQNGIQIQTSTTGNGYVLFGDGTGASAYRGQISYKQGDDYLNFLTAGVEAVRIDSTQDAHFDQDVIAFSTTPSDIRLKKNFTKIENGLDIVTQLEGHTFNWKKGGDRLSAGFKAQEVEKILPHLVDEKKLPLRADDDKEYKILRYEEMIPYLVEAIKEQQQQINELKEKLNG